MKRFSWKITFCVVPVILSLAVVAYAYNVYLQGGSGFKLGVDLAGGTDLIYEVDLDKFPSGQPSGDYNSAKLAAPQAAYRPRGPLQRDHPSRGRIPGRNHSAYRGQASGRG